ncbi:MAG: class I SAM-dependent methyltransferase [Azonexus sp.]
MREALLEPWLRHLRIRRVLPSIRRYPDCHLLDIGCGWEARLLRTVEPYIGRGVGLDVKAPPIATPRITTHRLALLTELPLASASFDIVTMLATLEHLAHPAEMVAETFRVLRPGGRVLITVPSRAAQPVLEFLAYRLGLISAAEIRDHKQYFDRESLQTLFSAAGFSIERQHYFQFGMNNFLLARKPPAKTWAGHQEAPAP